ncbi:MULTISPECIES: ATP synthase F1 subunit gamma [Gordonibacter]|uniref:ATP synthase gamma chain n=1 Tax=Gordonibacter faecis TaxID=3047475 RepID=A0ABT7DRE9_9ACTN|nr:MULTISPECIES: ATP synthase F1 subunit gamma [unclassified Gordonibacter]MDJ1651842.1 ATP synthase F1 subunit gamma [Gordonibacter sp. KGMB12511]HIW75625.1 ATP synthase F1 subunit gamma [Candidatus Gordonibacter avicola]
MPNLHDIERRINSVTSTKQITRTMEMVAAAKIRRATERVEDATPYSDSMMEMLANVAERVGGAENALLSKHDEIKNVLVVVVVSDRGLAGGFNSNVLRHAEHLMKEKKAAGADVHIVACGKKACGYFSYRKIAPVLEFKDLSADPTVDEAAAIAAYAIDGYEKGELDEVIVVYNHAKNAAEQTLREELVLPVDTTTLLEESGAQDADKEAESSALSGDVVFEPDAAGVLDRLLPAYVRTTLYHALIDSAAAEQAARRSAMKSATDNANEMVETLTRLYNRVRQGAITTEISEIVGGASALED